MAAALIHHLNTSAFEVDTGANPLTRFLNPDRNQEDKGCTFLSVDLAA